jgi:spore maturation protein A
MAMAFIWVAMAVAAILYGAATGNASAVGNAAMDGAKAAVTLCLAIGGPMCLWSGIMELMRRSGLSLALSRFLQPVLAGLFPSTKKSALLMDNLSHNLSANLLGLGNAATPAGVRAATELHRLSGGGAASDELCRLVVMNTASVQLLPTTVAAVRAAAGAQNAFDILPAVWISSVFSVSVGLLSAAVFAALSRR